MPSINPGERGDIGEKEIGVEAEGARNRELGDWSNSMGERGGSISPLLLLLLLGG